jgi:thiamine-phosphate pyrophosphorylase
MHPLADRRLYAFLDAAYFHGRPIRQLAEDLCRGGADIVQLRAKNVDPVQIRSWAFEVAPILRSASIPLVINDYPEIAREVGAEWVHLGQDDFAASGFASVAELKNARCPGVCLGMSSHAPDQALKAVQAGADYVAVGPVFSTMTKPGRAAVTLDYVRWASENLKVPWFAIGGITLDNVASVLASGARRICVVSEILNAGDVAGACHSFKNHLTSAAEI